ncbi:hypothetical protein ABJ684_004902, partial [Escherichia coli]
NLLCCVLAYLRGAFNSKDKTTSNMIITHVMDHDFVCRLIDLAMRNAEKHLLKKAWKKNAAEKMSEVDFKEVRQALAKMLTLFWRNQYVDMF